MKRCGAGKRTLFGVLNSELESSNTGVVILCGAAMAVAGILVKVFGKSPYPVLLALGVQELVPPVWLMVLLWTLSLFTVGCAAGLVFSSRIGGVACEKYQTALFFLLLFVLELLWYPTLFSGLLVFFSALIALLALAASIVLTVITRRVSRLSSLLFFLHDIWLSYLLILNFAILFRS